MAEKEFIKGLCFDERGTLKTKGECRAAIINHLILEEMVDIDEAEDLADKSMREFNLWPEPTEAPAEKPLENP